MFIEFFYTLKQQGVPVSPTAFLTLHKALDQGLINTLDDFYTASRAILIKSERYFDLFDQVFANVFKGIELPDKEGLEIDEIARAMLEEWLREPENIARMLGTTPQALSKLTPDELLEYFKERLKEQTGRHQGGNKWIGTRGTSPVGHSGYHPGGMRVGGVSMNKSAVKVAMERRYKDYSLEGPLTQAMIGEALKRLRYMVPSGPKDQINVDDTINKTIKNAGEIEIVFDRSLKDRLKVILAIDNGGWSMDPYIDMVQTLFNYARAQFKELKTVFFHNTIYDTVWEDPRRYNKPIPLDKFLGFDHETRLIIVGDASMAPYELMASDGSINPYKRSGLPSLQRLQQLAENFPHSVWLNPVPQTLWKYTRTIGIINNVFYMTELTIDGLEQAVKFMMIKK